MIALTVRQPWAWAIAHAGKDAENRIWVPPTRLVGQRIAIHAGARRLTRAELEDALGASWWPGERLESQDQLVYGAVIATARLEGYALELGGYFPTERVEDLVLGSPWFTGPAGWLLADVRPLAFPVPARGALGPWALPAEVEAAIVADAPAVDP